MDFYALKKIINCHVDDIRDLQECFFPPGGFVTVSRNGTAKIWTPKSSSYEEFIKLKGTSNSSSLCCLPESSEYLCGLIVIGSFDGSITGFEPNSPDPVLRLLGHSGAVDSLSFLKDGLIVSGSRDRTARVWSGQKCLFILQGHLKAIWATAVFPTQKVILTGSADLTIRLWRAGICEQVFEGHSGGIKALAILSDRKFLSCSHDTTVRMWVITGLCLQIFQSHKDYIQSICLCDHWMDFISCGSDQKLKIWRNGVSIQTIVFSSKKLWNVINLANGNLAVGTGDGKVYIFQAVAADYFDNAAQQSGFIMDKNVHIIDKESSISRASDLKSSIHSGKAVITYHYESTSMYLCKYDDIEGITIKKDSLNFEYIEKNFFLPEKKHDCAVDIEVDNTMYKLSFNKKESPWSIASEFVTNNNMSMDNVQWIVDIIIKKTGQPFFNEIYPVQTYLIYTKLNKVGLQTKFLEFSMIEDWISPDEVDDLMMLTCYPDTVPAGLLDSLRKVLSWSEERLFPGLHLLRVAVGCKCLWKVFASKEFLDWLLDIFLHTYRHINRVLVEKILCNMFGFSETERIMIAYQDKVYEAVKEKIGTGEECIQKDGTALFFNYAIASYNGLNVIPDKFVLAAIDILQHLVDSEAIYQMLVAIGTICCRNPIAVSYLKSFDFMESILRFKPYSVEIGKVVDLLQSDFYVL